MKRVPTPKLCAEIRAEVAQLQATRSELLLREALATLENIRTKLNSSESVFHDEAIARSDLKLTDRRLAAAPDPRLNPGSLVNTPSVNWTPAEQQAAEARMRFFLNHDE